MPRLCLLLLTFAALLLEATSAFAGGFLPLETGNEWIYRDSLSGGEHRIRVGLPFAIGGNVYYHLSGYAVKPLLVRTGDDGSLYYRDEEHERDVLLTGFQPAGGGWFDAPFRECAQEGQVQEKPRGYEGSAGRFPSTLEIRYRSHGCADAGVEEEIFAENIGMLRRVNSTIAGPRVADLVYARVGSITLNAGQGTDFSITVAPPEREKRKVDAVLRLSVSGSSPLKLAFPTGQDYELLLKDSGGGMVWRWSEGQFFTQAERKVTVGREGLRFAVEVPLVNSAGWPLPEGEYILEAWLVAGSGGREMSASTRFELN